MKVSWKKLFSISESDAEFFNNNQDKIELLGCKTNGYNCRNCLPEINALFRESDNCNREKDFHNAIEALENAFNKTHELQEASCLKCAQLFRSTITESLEGIHSDLAKMSTGMFRTRRYESSYLKAGVVLKKFRNEEKPRLIYPLIQKSKKDLEFQPIFSHG
jgi:hypothetical protein